MALEDIGEYDTALLCMTNFAACCRSQDGPVMGNWFFPNGSRVLNRDRLRDFDRTRGQMVVRMHRRRGGVDGIYRCEIPVSANAIQAVYIGVYNTNSGEIE